MKAKRIIIRARNLYRRFFKIFDGKDYIMTEEDVIIIKLVKNMLAKENVKVFYAPLSHSIYMQTDDHEYTVIYDDTEIKVCNHKVFLTTKISVKVGENLMRIGKKKIENSIQKLEAETRKNEVYFIKGIADILENEKDC